jgi:hypothetical protein
MNVDKHRSWHTSQRRNELSNRRTAHQNKLVGLATPPFEQSRERRGYYQDRQSFHASYGCISMVAMIHNGNGIAAEEH